MNIVDKLITSGVDENAENNQGVTPWEMAKE